MLNSHASLFGAVTFERLLLNMSAFYKTLSENDYQTEKLIKRTGAQWKSPSLQ